MKTAAAGGSFHHAIFRYIPFAASLAFGAGVERGVKRRVNPAGCFIAVFAFVLMTIGVIIAVAMNQR